MTDATAAADPPAKASGKKKLIPILAAVALAGGGFASTYLGLWSPAAMLAPKREAPAVPATVFVAVPVIDAQTVTTVIAWPQDSRSTAVAALVRTAYWTLSPLARPVTVRSPRRRSTKVKLSFWKKASRILRRVQLA